MSKVILYVAASIDGYIASKDGGVGWLEAFNDVDGFDYGYSEFYERLGTLIMGGKTYRQIREFGTWPYPNVTSYVVTTREVNATAAEDIHAFQGDLVKLVAELKSTTEKDIWLVGGGELNAAFLEKDLIDEYIISIMPILLGAEIPLVKDIDRHISLTLEDSKTYPNGVVQLHYRNTTRHPSV